MRQELAHRPLLLVFLIVAAGLGCTFSWWSLLFVAGIPFLAPNTRTGAIIALCGAFAVLARPALEPPMWQSGQPVEGEAVMVTVPQPTATGSNAIAKWEGKRVRIRFPDRPHLVPGDHLRLSGTLKPLSEGSGYSLGAYAALNVETFTLKSQGASILRPGLAARDHFLSFVDRSLSPTPASFVNAVCFGDVSKIEQDQWSAFQRSGTTHVVSTSGLHATVTAAFLFLLLSLLPIARVWHLILLSVVLILYTSAAGFGPPIVRASIMVLCWQSAYLFRREPDALSALAFAGILNLAIDLYAIGQIGFWLSNLAIASLAVYVPFDKDSNWLINSLKATTAVTVVTAPTVAAVFGRIPLVALLANLVVIPAVSILVVVSLASWILSWFAPSLGTGLLRILAEPLANATEYLVRLFGNLPLGLLEAPYLPPALVIALTICLFGFWRPYVRPA